MKKEFVPYELAVKLKELGFDEKCLMFYTKSGNPSYLATFKKEDLIEEVLAPLWQQAFDWFREKYGLEGYAGLCHFIDMSYGYNITTYIGKSHYLAQGRDYKTYEEARQACLEKLIEIVSK